MTDSLLVSQTVDTIASDRAALLAVRPLLQADRVVTTVLWDGNFSSDPGGEPQNVFAMLAAGGGSTWQSIYFGLSFSSPNAGWTWALIAKLAERMDGQGEVVLPFRWRSEERLALLDWAGFAGPPLDPAAAKRAPPEYLELPAMVVRRQRPKKLAHWSVAVDQCLQHLTPFLAGDAELEGFKPGEIRYLFHSGASRAHAIARSVAGALPARSGLRFIDFGAAFGLVSVYWMLIDARLTAATAVEMSDKYIEPGIALAAAILPPDRSIQFVKQRLQEFDAYAGADIAAFIHALHMLSPQDRRMVIDRAWEALPADGVLVLNETIRTRVPTSLAYAATAIELAEVLELRRLASDVLVYGPADRWQRPTPIQEIDPSGWTSEHVIVIRKRQAGAGLHNGA